MSFLVRDKLSHRRQHRYQRQPSKEPEEKLPPALNQPLSLEQSAICCIVTNLEKYPPDMLALLPLGFRRELLLLLPPADIFQLEQTKVVDGIDMDNEIWKVVSERYDYKVAHTAHCNENVRTYTLMKRSRRGSSCRQLPFPIGIKPVESSSPQLISWKARFVSCLVSYLFYMTPLQLSTDHADMCDRYSKCFGWRNYVVLLQLLFCNQFFKLKQLTDVGGFPLQVSEVTLLPSRYSRFFTSLVPPSEWVRFFLEKCHIPPPHSITIDLQQFNIESGTTFQRFLSNAKNVKIFVASLEASNADQTTTEKDKVARLRSMLTSSHQLENMSITQHVPYVLVGCCIVRRAIDQSQFNKVLQNCFFHPLFVEHSINRKHLDLFRGLKRIDITGNETAIGLSTLCSLFVFTQNHNFESISVSGLFVRCDPHQKEIVLQALVQSFTSPISSTCTLISLTDIAQLPFSFLFWLVKKFLYSPSTVPQKMVISSCHIDYTAIPSGKELNSIPKPPNLDDSHKSLQFSRSTLEHAFVEALARLPSLVLDELHIDHSSLLTNNRRRDSVTTDVLCALILTLPTIPVCRIKSLSLQYNMSGEWKLYRESLPTLRSCDPNFIGTLFKMAQMVPETAVSLLIVSKYPELLLGCLHNEWKKNGGNVKLDQLLIHLSDSFARTPGFRSSVEASLMVYPIHEIATNVDIRDKGNGSSIFELESSDN